MLYFFFKRTPASQAKGVEFLMRFTERTEDRDEPSDLATRDAQYDAIVEWGIPDHGALERLAGITHPVFAASGDDDQMIPLGTRTCWPGCSRALRSRSIPTGRTDSCSSTLRSSPRMSTCS